MDSVSLGTRGCGQTGTAPTFPLSLKASVLCGPHLCIPALQPRGKPGTLPHDILQITLDKSLDLPSGRGKSPGYTISTCRRGLGVFEHLLAQISDLTLQKGHSP